MKNISSVFLNSLLLLILWSSSNIGFGSEHFVTVASTTSTENSGLFNWLIPKFTSQSGIDVRVVAVGTGKAIKLAERGDADVLLVHHQPSEIKFVEQGFGLQRFNVMYNDFVLVGPRADPAEVANINNVLQALSTIASGENVFISRGDDSGTHKKERSLWNGAGVDVVGLVADWYRETGSGMGATLNVASAVNGYTLTDRATWLKFANKGDLTILLQGDPPLFNQYGIVLVNPARHAHIKQQEGQALIDWILSHSGQTAIDAYTIDGQRAFFANANP